jgi:hypothetical protein
MNAGIDYGRGMANIDHATGIRYGCISQNTVSQAWCDSAEPQYGPPTCPECGNECGDVIPENMDWPHYRERVCDDYACITCKHLLDSGDVYGDEPLGYIVDDGEYKMEDCLDCAILITKSPYYTYAPFCSLCVPGAGDLDNAREGGVKTYCLGHDWFEYSDNYEGGRAPYPVYRIDDDEKVRP